MNPNLIKQLMADYESSLRLNAKLTSTLLAMSKALLEMNNSFGVEVAEMLIADVRKQFDESQLIQQDKKTFKTLLDLIDDIEAECQVKKLLINN